METNLIKILQQSFSEKICGNKIFQTMIMLFLHKTKCYFELILGHMRIYSRVCL